MTEMKTLTIGGTTYEVVDDKAREDIKKLQEAEPTEGADGGHYTPSVNDNGNGTMTVSFTASKAGMPSVNPITITLPVPADGEDGQDGQDGENGGYYTPSVHTVTANTFKISFAASKSGMPAVGDVTITLPAGKDGTNGTNGTNGQDGADGVGIESIVQTTTSTADGGENIITVTLTNGNKSTFTVKNGSKGNTGATGATGADGKDGSNGKDGADGVGIKSIVKTATSGLVDTYTITFTNNATATFTVTNGKDGANGDKGDPYTLTEADKVEIANKVILHFGGSPVQCVVTDDAKIILTGVPVGTYTAYFDMGDGELAECGVLALSDETPLNTYTVTFVADGVTVATIEYTEGDTALSGVPDVPAKDGYTGVWESYDISKGGNITVNAVYTEIPANTYTVTKTATYCVISGNDSATEDEAYTATVTANSGYEMSSIKVTMGGTDITSSAVSGNNISIASVTGNIVITATATKVITNWLPLATLADGDTNTIQNGIVSNKRLGSSDGTYRDLVGHNTTGFIPVKYGDELFISNITIGGTNEFICYYGADKLKVTASGNTGTTLTAACTATDGGYTTPISNSAFAALANVTANIAYIRLCGSGITENTVINIKRNGEWL